MCEGNGNAESPLYATPTSGVVATRRARSDVGVQDIVYTEKGADGSDVVLGTATGYAAVEILRLVSELAITKRALAEAAAKTPQFAAIMDCVREAGIGEGGVFTTEGETYDEKHQRRLKEYEDSIEAGSNDLVYGPGGVPTIRGSASGRISHKGG